MVARRGQLARGGGALVGQVVGLRHVEDEVDRVELDDGGQQRRWRRTRLPTSTRRSEMRPLNGALTWVKPRLSCASRTAAVLVSTAALAESSSASRWSSVAFAWAAVLTSWAVRACSSWASLSWARAWSSWACGAVGRRLVGARIDDEQDLARLDELAVPELDLLHVARDAGADLDLLHRLEAAGELVVLRQATHERGSDRDRRGAGGPAWACPAPLLSQPAVASSETASTSAASGGRIKCLPSASTNGRPRRQPSRPGLRPLPSRDHELAGGPGKQPGPGTLVGGLVLKGLRWPHAARSSRTARAMARAIRNSPRRRPCRRRCCPGRTVLRASWYPRMLAKSSVPSSGRFWTTARPIESELSSWPGRASVRR